MNVLQGLVYGWAAGYVFVVGLIVQDFYYLCGPQSREADHMRKRDLRQR